MSGSLVTRLLLTISTLLFVPYFSIAAERTWSGAGPDGNWTTAANWVGGIAPVANDDLVFPAGAPQFSTNNNFPLLTNFRSIAVTGGDYTIGGSLFRTSHGIDVSAGTLTVSTAVTLNGAQTFKAENGASLALLALSMSGSALEIDSSGIVSLGLISGTGGITKTGIGIAAIFTASGYSSPITLSNGILIIDANIPGSAITVNSSISGGGTEFSGLGGTGTVGSVNVIEGIVSAGTLTSPTGVFNISGGLTISQNGAFVPKIGGIAPGAGHDQLNVTGSVNLNNSILAPIPWDNFVPVVGDTFVIINNDGADPVNGTFLNLPEGSVFAGPLNTAYRISYVAGTGNDVAITRVPKAPFDFDGDGKSDIGIYDGTTWRIRQSQNSVITETQFGLPTDIIAPADFDGDNRADHAVFRPENGFWYILRSADSTVDFIQFGAAGDVPVPNDFDGDGRADVAVFRPSNGVWYQLRSLGNQFYAIQFGMNGDIPLIADFDGDGFGDPAVFRPSEGNWYFWLSSTDSFMGLPFGTTGDVPISADFNGDGRTDIAVFRPSADPQVPDFYVLTSGDYDFYGGWWGNPGDISVVADYDGDGKADFAVFRPEAGTWYILGSSAGFISVGLGEKGHRPIPAAFGQLPN